jgi:hypothetical protein
MGPFSLILQYFEMADYLKLRCMSMYFYSVFQKSIENVKVEGSKVTLRPRDTDVSRYNEDIFKFLLKA